MATTSGTIGFVGLGHMGGSMAARFLAAGYPVYGEEQTEHAQQLIGGAAVARHATRGGGGGRCRLHLRA
jgi:3-hydroxyisobutyrate dehydrogenase-like beta-hydroxyacid dehydrogenase